MKNVVLLLALVFSVNVMAHCPLDFSAANICGDLLWSDGPYLNRASTFNVRFWQAGDHTHAPVKVEFDLNIYSWMTMDNGHSHGGPKMTVTSLGDGIYEVRDARFFMHGMKGFWEVRVDLSTAGNLISRASSRVVLPDGHGHH